MVVIKAILKRHKESLDKHKIIRGANEVLLGLAGGQYKACVALETNWNGSWFSAGKDHFTLHRGNMLVLEYCTSALQLLKFKIIGLDLEKNTNICVEMKVS